MPPPHAPPFNQFLSNATDSRNVFPSIQQLLESNINWNQQSMSSSSLCFSLPKDRWQNKSFLHRPSCFNYPVPMQDWWPYTRCLQGLCISSPGLLWQRAEEIPEVLMKHTCKHFEFGKEGRFCVSSVKTVLLDKLVMTLSLRFYQLCFPGFGLLIYIFMI